MTPFSSPKYMAIICTVKNAILDFCDLDNLCGIEECHPLGCDTMYLLLEQTFQGNVLPSSSGWNE
jgi:hypothetical protein